MTLARRLIRLYEAIIDNSQDAPPPDDQQGMPPPPPDASQDPNSLNGSLPGVAQPPPPMGTAPAIDPFSPAGNPVQSGNPPPGEPKQSEWPHLNAKTLTRTLKDGTSVCYAYEYGKLAFKKKFACADHMEDYIANWLDNLEHRRIVSGKDRAM